MTAPEPQEPSGAESGGFVDALVMPGASTTGKPPWWRAVGALLCWGLAQTLPILPGSYPYDPAHFKPLLPPLVGLAVTLALAAAFVWRMAIRVDGETPYRTDTFRLRRPSPGTLRRLPAVGLPLLVMVATSLIIVPRFIPVPRDPNNPLEQYLKLPFALLTVLALVSVVAPLLEEFFFRGWIQRKLERRLTPSRAILLTALIFAAAHGEMFGFPIRLVFGLVAGTVAWRTQSIWPGVLLHSLYNATLVLGSSATPDVDETTLERWAHTGSVFFPTLAVFLLAGLVLVFVLGRFRPQMATESHR